MQLLLPSIKEINDLQVGVKYFNLRRTVRLFCVDLTATRNATFKQQFNVYFKVLLSIFREAFRFVLNNCNLADVDLVDRNYQHMSAIAVKQSLHICQHIHVVLCTIFLHTELLPLIKNAILYFSLA